MAAAMGKLLSGARSISSSQAPIPAIRLRGLQEGVAPILPHAGSSPAASAAGRDRLMHTAQWRNCLPQQKALPFGRHGFLSQEQKVLMTEQLNIKRNICNLPQGARGNRELRHRYMQVPGYEVYESQFAMLHLWDKIKAADKWIKDYQNSWPYPAILAVLVAGSAVSVYYGHDNHMKNEKLLAETKSNLKKAEASVDETEKILQQLERDISHAEARRKGKDV